ncbi:hypothetical protein KAFR_0B03200 [Kazachstania africana CBS 2517]|uniref:AB hydrolase-1 domain-containing protein n=1 Tax=Kazachstania africana (strain ATCC 22294 / BCRC 22015 / CBS 2517 / CECT 1963 / NBRC 1671 / NRRL Y-8276) TaxID=1071382 RepID=H2AQG6_KAZAF|nr:hypothetical protein KAFR_0B03200 [Kazachstania africana CBS 2517]CCF56616.1 hypothetical protein KAFR_0B03200 [Kazachstania africana CBS 2517]
MLFKRHWENWLVVQHVKSPVELVFKGPNAIPPISLSTLIDRYVPEFSDGARDKLSALLFNGHLQTSFTALKHFENIDQINYKRLIVQYPDKGEGAIDIAVAIHTPSTYVPPNQAPFVPPLDAHYSYFESEDLSLPSLDDKPMLIAIHGLTGGSHESYVRTIVHKLTTLHGFEACVINSRGCCQSKITTPQLYNGGWTNDVRHCVKELRSLFPNRKFYMMGFSLGASILTNYIGEEGARSDIECCIVLGNPWDLLRSSYFINASTFGSKIYSPTMANNLCKLAVRHSYALKDCPLWEDKFQQKIKAVRTIKQFDDTFTGPMFGYKDAFEYYGNASSFKRIEGIRTPFLAINAIDDPVVGGQELPDAEFRENPYTLMLKTNIGGHIAWLKNKNGMRWYADPICKFLRAFHTEITLKKMKPCLDSKDLPKIQYGPVKTSILEWSVNK